MTLMVLSCAQYNYQHENNWSPNNVGSTNIDKISMVERLDWYQPKYKYHMSVNDDFQFRFDD